MITAQNKINAISSLLLELVQLLAVTIKNLILFDIGLNIAFGGIVIPSLTGSYRNEHNLNETLSLTPVQASWLGIHSHSENLKISVFTKLFFPKFRSR